MRQKFHLPLLSQLTHYNKQLFTNDLIAGLSVCIVVVPQSMAYALLAGVPVEYGLYCAILPTLLYALLGSSRSLSVGPAALIAIMVATSVAQLAPTNDAQYMQYVVMLSILTGSCLLLMRLLRLGNLTHYISTPVISGFTSAAALLIIGSQLQHLFGLHVTQSGHFLAKLYALWQQLADTNLTTLSIGLASLLILGLCSSTYCQQYPLIKQLNRIAALLVVLISALWVEYGQLDSHAQVRIVGEIPSRWPLLPTLPLAWSAWQPLLLPAFFIALMCFLTSIAVGSQLATLRKEHISPNQELLALAVANMGAALSSTFALAASLGRSALNHKAGAQTAIAAVISALGVLLTLLFFSQFFYFLPLAVLGSIVIISVSSMIQLSTLNRCWRINRSDAISWLATFFTVIFYGIELGMFVGMLCSIILLLHRASHPHIAVVGQIENTEHFRNIKRHCVTLKHSMMMVRVDESIYFANVQFIETFILNLTKQYPKAKHLVLICQSVSFVDTTAIDTLSALIDKLRQQQITLHLAEVKGPVMDQLENSDFLPQIAPGEIFLTTKQAVDKLAGDQSDSYTNHPPYCPLSNNPV